MEYLTAMGKQTVATHKMNESHKYNAEGKKPHMTMYILFDSIISKFRKGTIYFWC